MVGRSHVNEGSIFRLCVARRQEVQSEHFITYSLACVHCVLSDWIQGFST